MTRPPFWGIMLLLFACSPLFSQPFSGLSFDNYGGVHGLLLNPAHAAANNVGFELQLAAAEFRLANDYMALPEWQVIAEGDEFYHGDMVRSPREDNYLSATAEVLGPSLLIGLGPRIGLGVLTRVRSMYGLRNVDGRLFEGQQNEFDEFANFSGTSSDFHTNGHAWGEVAVVLGSVLVNQPTLVVKGGAAVKVLRGIGGRHAYSPELAIAYDASTAELTTGGMVEYAALGNLEFDDLGLEDLSDPLGKGLGFDLGVSAEWRPEGVAKGKLRSPYRLKLGASLVDLGSVTYENADISSYNVDASIPAGEVEGSDLEDILDRYYDGTTRSETADFRLPTALYLHLDYRLAGPLFVSVLSASAIGHDPQVAGNRIDNTFTIAPRFESKWFSLYAPARLGGPSGTALGAGLRLGFVNIGSGTLLSHLFTDTNYAFDVYAGVKLPFYRRTKVKKADLPKE